MFPCVVFDKRQSARQSSVRLDLRRMGSISLSSRLERMSALVTTLRWTALCIAFHEEAHRSSSRSVAFLNGARLGQSAGVREARRKKCVLSQAYTRHGPRADGFTLHGVRRFLYGTSRGFWGESGGPHVWVPGTGPEPPE